ncbi:hypothetical protein OG909_18945 [Streptomyces sp. NBC_01754]|uniref:hypothetical protein n=1 Tax=Streptomyces sp. NBC_01754 TaxID=2975930 RepID=UPI002DD84184|nr:hypothetical protein [Streptomyces sp. NBC_01754]WSC94174.1 hypothetical protein OG909_18945 [Streptomyces sp. NBC_01754]
MTQSGQGDEQQPPAVQPAHEGLVLPSQGSDPWAAGGRAGNPPAEPVAPAGGQPWGRSWGPQSAPQGGLPPGQLPPEQPQPYAPQHDAYQSPQQYGQQSGYGAPQDPYQQPHQHHPSPQYAQPLPPEVAPGGDADATQYIAPVPGGPGPVPYPGDADATQHIPPVPGGDPYGIGPGAPGERQPPSEFDSLFRSQEPAGATQQMAPVDPAQRHQQPHQQSFPDAYGQPGPPPAAEPYRSGLQGLRSEPEPEPEYQGHAEQRRRSPHIPLIAAVVVGCAVVGLGAGALMSGGGDSAKDDKQPVAAQSSPPGEPSAPAADPAKPQAEALDKLLADSNSSRAAVIGAVEKIKDCRELDQAADDLKGAAAQRRDLVTRLEEISVDQLPDHEQLTSSLTEAWHASAEADDHYAAWAGQAKRNHKKICRGGTARTTDEKAKADNSSGEATRAKQKASELWNTVARKYGLTEHAPTEL